jgi:hypothetical protein
MGAYVSFHFGKETLPLELTDQTSIHSNVESLYTESNEALQKFLESMEQYDAVAKPRYKTNLIIRDAHGWDEVHRVIDASVEAYQVQATSGIWGRIRSGFRKFSNANGSCCAFLELIPSSSVFTATLWGAEIDIRSK